MADPNELALRQQQLQVMIENLKARGINPDERLLGAALKFTTPEQEMQAFFRRKRLSGVEVPRPQPKLQEERSAFTKLKESFKPVKEKVEDEIRDRQIDRQNAEELKKYGMSR